MNKQSNHQIKPPTESSPDVGPRDLRKEIYTCTIKEIGEIVFFISFIFRRVYLFSVTFFGEFTKFDKMYGGELSDGEC